MLAKLWKKVLLAVCIIACIFNVMSKLVNRNSLEVNLKSANDGNTVFDLTRKDSQPASPGIIQEVKEVLEERKQQNITQNNNVVPEESDSEEMPDENDSQDQEPEEKENPEEKNNDKTVTYKDYTFVELF